MFEFNEKKSFLKKQLEIDIRRLYNSNIDFYVGPKNLSFETYYFDCEYVKNNAVYICFSDETKIVYEKIIEINKRKTFVINVKNKKGFDDLLSNFRDYNFYIIKTPNGFRCFFIDF